MITAGATDSLRPLNLAPLGVVYLPETVDTMMQSKEFTMRFTTSYLGPLVAAVAIAAAPLASASPLSCTDVGSATSCSSPGNSQITASTPPVQQQLQVIIIHRNHR